MTHICSEFDVVSFASKFLSKSSSSKTCSPKFTSAGTHRRSSRLVVGEPSKTRVSYKSKDGLSVEVCLENPKLIATARCSLPLEVCLANPQYISQVGCSGQLDNLPPLSLGKISKQHIIVTFWKFFLNPTFSLAFWYSSYRCLSNLHRVDNPTCLFR